MRHFLDLTLKAPRGRAPGSLAQRNSAAQHFPLQALTWIWGLLGSLALMSLYLLDRAWLAPLLGIAGVIISVAFVGRARSRRRRLQPAPYLSRGCNTVWQLDREG